MRFNSKKSSSSLPQINLIPMLDVLMSVLTFFILTAMTLTGKQLGDILLPGVEKGLKPPEEKPLIVGLQKDGKILLEENENPNQTDIEAAIKEYLETNPEGTVILKADRALPYEEVDRLLKQMIKIGGSNVSLAIEKS